MYVSGSHFQAKGGKKKVKKGLAHDLPPGYEPGGKPKPSSKPVEKMAGGTRAKPLASAKVNANKRKPKKA